LKLRELAYQANLTVGYLSKLENDKNDGIASELTLIILSGILNIEPEDLLLKSGKLPSIFTKFIITYMLENQLSAYKMQELILNKTKPPDVAYIPEPES